MEATTIQEVSCQAYTELPYKVPLVLYRGEVTQILCRHLDGAKCLFSNEWCYLVDSPGQLSPFYTGPHQKINFPTKDTDTPLNTEVKNAHIKTSDKRL